MTLEEQQLEAGIAALEAQRGLRSSRLLPGRIRVYAAVSCLAALNDRQPLGTAIG
jgi:hypothetical protein